MPTRFSYRQSLQLLFELETPLEQAIAIAPEWLAGLEWGSPRPGHPEGKVSTHIRDVLQNIDRFYCRAADRAKLRLIALIHDTFKYQTARPPSTVQGPPHSFCARVFAENFIDDIAVLQAIERHDDAYKIWRGMTETRNPMLAEVEAQALIAQLGDHLELFMRFYHCDSRTAGKSADHYRWFKRLVDQYQGCSRTS
jgi:hypothetical protein